MGPLRRGNNLSVSAAPGQLPRMGSLGFRLTFPPDMAMMLGNPSEIMGNEGVVCMIREERLLGAFRELVSIDNPTLRERGVCDHLLRRYAALGIRLQEDGTGAAIGGNAGNLYAFVPGDESIKIPGIAADGGSGPVLLQPDAERGIAPQQMIAHAALAQRRIVDRNQLPERPQKPLLPDHTNHPFIPHDFTGITQHHSHVRRKSQAKPKAPHPGELARRSRD